MTAYQEAGRHFIDNEEYGLYHVVCPGSCSRYEFAKEIVSLAGLDVTIQKVPHEQSDFSAVRPVNAVLNNFILSLTDIYDFPEWKDSLKKYLKEIGEIA